MDPIVLTLSDGEQTFTLAVGQYHDGIGGRISERVDGQRVDAFAQTNHNPETRYATAGECLLALMRALFPALGIRA